MRAGFVVGAVCLVAATGYTLREVATNRQQERRREVEGRLFNLAPEEVTAVSLTRPGETVRLERSAEGWRMLSPAEAKTDAGATGDLLRLISSATVSRTIEAEPTDPARFGLGASATRIAVTTAAGKQEIEVGLEAPTEEGVYVRRPGSPAVLLAGAGARDLSQVDARLLVERTLLPTAGASTRVDLRGRQGSTILSVKNGAWYVSEPFQFPADRVRVTSLLDAFSGQKRVPPPRKPEPGEVGLSPPRIEVVFMGADGSETTFHFGDHEGDSKLWATIGNEPPFLVDASLEALLREMPEDWCEKRPASVDRYKATAIALRWTDRVLMARKDASGWKDSRGRSLPEPQVLALLAALCDTPGELITRELRSARIHPTLSAEIEEEGGRRQIIEGFGPEPDGTWLLRPRGFHPLLRIPATAIKALRDRLDAIQGSEGPGSAASTQK